MSDQRMQVVLNHLNGPVDSSFKSTAANKYIYTLNNNLLSDEQRNFYEDNGYLLIPNLIDHNLLNECKKRFIDICNGKVDKGQMLLMKDKSLMRTTATGEYLIYKAQDIIWDEVLSKYIMDPKILDYVECFTGPDITAVQSMLINKPPDSGKMTSAHPLHQDLHYFPFRPADRIVASWTAMERASVENGCMFVIPGTHKCALQPHGYPEKEVNKGYHGVKGFDSVPRLNLEMDKGDTIFFHPLLMHGSSPNMTQGFRKTISCHYASSKCHYIDVKGTTQENIAKEVEDNFKRKGIDISFVKTYRYRQRHLKGDPGTLASCFK